MIIKELFQKDIYRTINGVVYADKTDNDIVAQELDEYVLTGELKKYLNRLFEVYSESLKRADSGGHMGVWISGFFGSGKSHFLKILSYLFENRHVKINGETKQAIDFFRDKISDNMAFKMIEDAVKVPTDVILFNIDSLSFQNDEQAAVLKAFFGVFNRKRGFCFLYPHIAHVESFLVKKGVYEDFKKKFEALNGSSWETDREDYVFYADEMLQAIREAPGEHSAWIIALTNEMHEMSTPDAVEIARQGPVQAAVRVSYRFRDSYFVQEIGLTADVPRVNLALHADWYERDCALKVAFPVAVANGVATFDQPYGSIVRPANGDEVPAQYWVDLSTPEQGVSLLNNCRYAFDINGQRMRMTLLRGIPDLDPQRMWGITR